MLQSEVVLSAYKPMKGLLYIAPEGIRTLQAIKKWIDYGLNFTKTLPKK